MRVVCVRAQGRATPGDVTEVPDGAAVSDLYWRPADGQDSPAGAAGAGEIVPDGPADEDGSE